MGRFDKETLEENMRNLEEQRNDLETLSYEELREKQRARREQKRTEEEVIFDEMRKHRDYPDCSKEPPAHVLWAVEYSDTVTCPGCGEHINMNWDSVMYGKRCPLCHQELDIDFYIS